MKSIRLELYIFIYIYIRLRQAVSSRMDTRSENLLGKVNYRERPQIKIKMKLITIFFRDAELLSSFLE